MAGVRRTWDKDYYEKRARDRAEQGDSFEEEDATTAGNKAKARRIIKEEFLAADDGRSGPMGSQRAFLKSREQKVDLDSKVGKVEIVNPTSADSSRGAGYWCEVCSCLLKDSVSYLDHINGRKHQRALGFSMRVERADVETVKERLDEIKRKIANKAEEKASRKSAIEKEEEAREMESIDPNIAELMGFTGFGGAKK
eukprot:gene31788-41257_t